MDISYQVHLRKSHPEPAALVRGHVELAGIPDFIGLAFSQVPAALSEQHLMPAGPPFARYGRAGGGFDVEAGFPASGPVTGAGAVHPTTPSGGPGATVLHRGSYAAVAATYRAADDWIGGPGLHPSGAAWECYLDGPDVPESRTLVLVPCRE